jgi:TPR repeat protein
MMITSCWSLHQFDQFVIIASFCDRVAKIISVATLFICFISFALSLSCEVMLLYLYDQMAATQSAAASSTPRVETLVCGTCNSATPSGCSDCRRVTRGRSITSVSRELSSDTIAITTLPSLTHTTSMTLSSSSSGSSGAVSPTSSLLLSPTSSTTSSLALIDRRLRVATGIMPSTDALQMSIAANWLALAYLTGSSGVTRDDAKAMEWFRRAAEGGSIIACYHYGMCLKDNSIVNNRVDYGASLHWLKIAAAKDHADSIVEVGNALRLGRGIPKDEVAAFDMFQRAALLGSASAWWQLGRCYAHGRGTSMDDELAVDAWTKAANGGHAIAALHIGIALMRGDAGPNTMNAVQGARYLDQAVAAGVLPRYQFQCISVGCTCHHAVLLTRQTGALPPSITPPSVPWDRLRPNHIQCIERLDRRPGRYVGANSVIHSARLTIDTGPAPRYAVRWYRPLIAIEDEHDMVRRHALKLPSSTTCNSLFVAIA